MDPSIIDLLTFLASDFLDTLDEQAFFNPNAGQQQPTGVNPSTLVSSSQAQYIQPAPPQQQQQQQLQQHRQQQQSQQHQQQPIAPASHQPQTQQQIEANLDPALLQQSQQQQHYQAQGRGQQPVIDPALQSMQAAVTNNGASAPDTQRQDELHLQQQASAVDGQTPAPEPEEPVLPAATMTEKFLLTAADQEPGTRDERLKRVISTKYEAGLLKPYNYVKGYARLSRWMDRNVSQDSKQQILRPLSVLRPKFRAIAQSLRDIDLVFIEEAFERLLLDYDRVFSAMGIPACLWRRTGEIYKGNREFAELVGLDGFMLRDGRLCIYELMAEESAVNYWEKYGNVAFDSTQKAVLTSCVLRFKPNITAPSGSITPAIRRTANTAPITSSLPIAATANSVSTNFNNNSSYNNNGASGGNTGGGGGYANGSGTGGESGKSAIPNEEGFINCCFSFTIRRDTWGIPSMIVGNFIRC